MLFLYTVIFNYETETEVYFMKIILLQTGKTTDKHIAELVDLYANRIKKYSVFEIITLPEIKNTRNMPVQEQKIKRRQKSFSRSLMMIMLFCLMRRARN